METSPISTCRDGACPLLGFLGHHVFISSFPCFASLHCVFIPRKFSLDRHLSGGVY